MSDKRTGVHLLIIAFTHAGILLDKGGLAEAKPLEISPPAPVVADYCLLLASLDSTKYLWTASMKGSAPAGAFTLPERVSRQLMFEP